MLPSPVRVCDTKWNWSEVPLMSLPPPLTVQVPVLGSKDWLPVGAGLPMSAQVQGPGQAWAGEGGGAVDVTITVSMVAALRAFVVPEATAIMARSLVPRLSVVPEPGMSVQTYPSVEE